MEAIVSDSGISKDVYTVGEDFAGGVTKVTVRNRQTGASFSVVPEFGGNVCELVLKGGGRLHSVVRGYVQRDDFLHDNTYRNWHLIPFPNRIRNGVYTFQGRYFQLPVNEIDRNNAHHGFFGRRSLAVGKSDVTESGSALRFSYAYTGDVPGYPFPFEVLLTYVLGASNGFMCSTEIRNTGSGPMPVGYGWHPYYTIGASIDELHLKLPTTSQVELDERMIPTGVVSSNEEFQEFSSLHDVRLDAVYKIESSGGISFVELYHQELAVGIRLWQETGRGKFGYLCAYTAPSRDSIAIEPMTCNVDAFNNGDGLIVLGKGESFAARCGVSML